jgi:hypothetical protein
MAVSRVPFTFKTDDFPASCTFINARMEHYSLLPSKCHVPVSLHTAMLEFLPPVVHVESYTSITLHWTILESVEIKIFL